MKTFPQKIVTKRFTNNKLNITEKIKGTWNWKEKEVIYTTQCFSHKVIEENKYIGHIRK